MTPLSALAPADARSLMRYLYRYSDDLTAPARQALEAHGDTFCRVPEDVTDRPAFAEALIEMVCSDAGKEFCKQAGSDMLTLGAMVYVATAQMVTVRAMLRDAMMPKAVGQA